jgi:signal transduction histidine kinase
MIVIGSRQERAARFPPRRPELETGSEAFVIIPLASEGRVLGVLHLGFDRPRQFGAEDRAFMQALGQQCAQALERARLQEEAAAAAAALETERFKTDLLNTVSHELRTPLAAIKGFSSAMLMFGGRMPEEEQRGFLTEIDAAADRLTELVDNLLDLARLESGSFQIVTAPIDLAEVLAAAVAESRVRHPERTITLELVERPLPVNGDTRRLRQVAANLLDNALKYSPNGGPVQVSAAPLPEGGVTFSVQDHGIGIPAVHIGKLFQRFYRVDTGLAREIGGTGLGLAICRRIVEEHGGQITVSSTEGEGSTFTVTLPGAPSRAGHHTG